MADFVAVLRKTIGNLGDNSPEMREKVYDKARSTIEAKLAAIQPPPPAVVVERQRKALEDAIAVVRADYEQPDEAEHDEDLEGIFASLELEPEIPPAPPAEPAAADTPESKPEPAFADEPQAQDDAAPEDDKVAPPPTGARDDALFVDPRPAAPQRAVAPQRNAKTPGRGGNRTGLVAALLLLAVAAGGSYLWLNSDALFGGSDATPPVAEAPADEEAATTAEELAQTPEDESAEEEIAALSSEEQSGEPAAPSATPGSPEKFTQRLMPDGSEVDDGPAGGQPIIGEGTSVAAVAPPEPDAPDAEQSGAAQTSPAASSRPAGQQQAGVAVGQRAIFYEERTSSAQGSAELGSIIWSVVQESPGAELPPEPAIRAEATIPGKDVQLRMTIRRNGDATLPASHIIEMIFLTPEGFEGGSIANVSRISFKETEQAAGSPLVGIPAKIADGFFLIALGDAPAEIQANMTLLRNQSWVDIPIVYQSGRRALLSLEKGIPGDRAFQDALRAWEAAAGTAG